MWNTTSSSLRILLLYCIWLTITADKQPNSFVVDFINGNFLLNRQPFHYHAGEIHYFRMKRESWSERLRSIREMNMNAIQYYIPWNFHEIRPGEYIFHGMHNFTQFSQVAQQMGLFSILRIGPYICRIPVVRRALRALLRLEESAFGRLLPYLQKSEWENGGIPWFVSADYAVELRSNNTKFREYVRSWFNVLLPKIKPMLYINGGSVLVLQIENEFGLYGTCDREYMEWLRDLVHEHLGPDVVLFTTDPLEVVKCGRVDGVLTTIDFGPQSQNNIQEKALALQKLLPGGRGPLVNSEYYTGWFTVWGQKNQTLPTDMEVVQGIRSMIDLNMSFSLYMAFGGTNFGYWSGSEPEGPLLTSYDYGAPIREDGTRRPLFNEIAKILPRSSTRNTYCNNYESRRQRECQTASTQAFGTFKLNRVGSISDLYEFVNCNEDKYMESFEESKHPYGFVIGGSHKRPDMFKELQQDKWSNYTKPYVYSYSKDRVQHNLDGHTDIHSLISGRHFLIENPGRLTYPSTKGRMSIPPLLQSRFHLCPLFDDTILAFARTPRTKGPGDFTGSGIYTATVSFTAATHIVYENWGKGIIFVNGANIGRYWNKGPQLSLFVDGGSTPLVDIVVVELLDYHRGCDGDSCYMESSATARWTKPLRD